MTRRIQIMLCAFGLLFVSVALDATAWEHAAHAVRLVVFVICVCVSISLLRSPP
jgi:hypothetical protein